MRDVLDVIRSIGSVGKHVHFHLHDGHPLIAGLPDHFTFLTRLPVPFSYQGRRSLSMMYGPGGLASIVSAATGACRPEAVSFTLEIHQVEGHRAGPDGDDSVAARGKELGEITVTVPVAARRLAACHAPGL